MEWTGHRGLCRKQFVKKVGTLEKIFLRGTNFLTIFFYTVPVLYMHAIDIIQ